jgi:hypothetical protein
MQFHLFEPDLHAKTIAIGLLDVWGQYARPVYWIWQKSLFVLGGLMLPLSLYPSWNAKACRCHADGLSACHNGFPT